MGTTTFGAGTVLNSYQLPGNSALLLALEEWLTLEGYMIWQKGLIPDERIELAPEVEPPKRWDLEKTNAEDQQKSADQQLLQALEEIRKSIHP